MIAKGKVNWCHINSLANTDSKKYANCWKTDLYPDSESENMLRSLGVKFKEDKDGRTFVTIKRNEYKNDGTKSDKPICVDDGNKPFSGNVGNGSVCKVQFSPFDYDGDTLLYLQGIQVLELVAYGAADGAEFSDETGGGSEFKAETKVVDPQDCPF